MRKNNKLLILCIWIIMIVLWSVFIIFLTFATTSSTTYEVEAKVLYYISDKAYCEDTNGDIWAFTTEGYTFQEGTQVMLEIYVGDMDYIQDDKVLSVKVIVE